MSKLAQDYLKAMFPPVYRVAGREMATLTLGHILLLQRLGNGFASDTPQLVGAGDYAAAMFVCTRTWRQALKAYRGSKRLLRWSLRRFVLIGDRLDKAICQFNDYLKQNIPVLDLTQPAGTRAVALNGPAWQIKRLRMMQAGKSFDDTMDMPVKLLILDEAQMGEMAMLWSMPSAVEEQVKDILAKMMMAEPKNPANA